MDLNNIKCLSAEANRYEFMVVFEHDGETWYWGAYRYYWDAEVAAKQCGGVIVHNLRVSGYKED